MSPNVGRRCGKGNRCSGFAVQPVPSVSVSPLALSVDPKRVCVCACSDRGTGTASYTGNGSDDARAGVGSLNIGALEGRGSRGQRDGGAIAVGMKCILFCPSSHLLPTPSSLLGLFPRSLSSLSLNQAGITPCQGLEHPSTVDSRTACLVSGNRDLI